MLTGVVRDDGQGFDPADAHAGFGLIGMRERITFGRRQPRGQLVARRHRGPLHAPGDPPTRGRAGRDD